MEHVILAAAPKHALVFGFMPSIWVSHHVFHFVLFLLQIVDFQFGADDSMIHIQAIVNVEPLRCHKPIVCYNSRKVQGNGSSFIDLLLASYFANKVLLNG